ncbi:hypothetical protein Tco_1217771 [Tanacetum coccineum]
MSTSATASVSLHSNNDEEKFRSADKTLARTLMAELTTMKLVGLKSMRQHVLDMINTATRLKTLDMNVDDSFLV